MIGGLMLAKAWVMIGGDSSGVSRELDETKMKVDNALLSISGGAMALLRPFEQFGKSILQQSFGLAKEYERVSTEMEVMLGSAVEAQKTLKRLTQFAVDTPFEMPSILQAANGLIQFGERGDQLMKTLKMLGDASGGQEQKFGLLTMVFNQIRGVGHLLTQDFRQLSTRGIISLQDIAKYYKVTTSAADQMLSSGRIKFTDFRKILESMTKEGGRFYDMMKKQSQTLGGLTSTLSDAFNVAKRQLLDGMIPVVKAFLNTMILLGNAMEFVIRNSNGMVGFALAGATAFATLGVAISGAAIAMKFFNLSLKQFLIGTGIGAALIVLGAAVGMVAGAILTSAPAVEFFTRKWNEATESFNAFYKKISLLIDRPGFITDWGRLIGEIGQKWNSVIANILDNLERFVDRSITLFHNLFGTADMSIKDIGIAFLDWVNDTLDLIDFWTTDFDQSFKLIVIYAEIAFFQILDYGINAFGELGAITAAWAAYIGAQFLNAGIGLVAVFAGAGSAIGTLMYNAARYITAVFHAAIQVIRGMFIGLWNGIKNKFMGKDFVQGFSEAWNKEIAKIGLPSTQGAMDSFNKTSKKVTTMLGGVNAQDAYDNTYKSLSGKRSLFGDKIKGLQQQGQDIVKDIQMTREMNRLYREAMKPKKQKEEEAKTGAAKGPSTVTIDAGRYGFAAIGTKIQDTLLKGGKDLGQQQVDLAKEGLVKQDQLIKNTAGISNVGGLGK